MNPCAFHIPIGDLKAKGPSVRGQRTRRGEGQDHGGCGEVAAGGSCLIHGIFSGTCELLGMEMDGNT